MKTYTDLMIDLETYGTSPGCVILEVALVAFNRNNDLRRIVAESYFPDINEQQITMGFRMEADTMAFWADNHEAWKFQLEQPRDPVDRVVRNIMRFWENYCSTEKTLVWAKGSHFDLPILRSIMKEPWSFRNIHDMRTLKLVSKSDIHVKSAFSHQGLADAIAQVEEVQKLCSIIGTGF